MATRVTARLIEHDGGGEAQRRSPKPSTARVPADRSRATSGSERCSPLATSATGCTRARVCSRRATSSVAGSTSAVYPSSPSRWVNGGDAQAEGVAERPRREGQEDEVAHARAELAGGGVGRVAELGGGGEHAGAGLGRDRLARRRR